MGVPWMETTSTKPERRHLEAAIVYDTLSSFMSARGRVKDEEGDGDVLVNGLITADNSAEMIGIAL